MDVVTFDRQRLAWRPINLTLTDTPIEFPRGALVKRSGVAGPNIEIGIRRQCEGLSGKAL
jgi:hypothetical protein